MFEKIKSFIKRYKAGVLACFLGVIMLATMTLDNTTGENTAGKIVLVIVIISAIIYLIKRLRRK